MPATQLPISCQEKPFNELHIRGHFLVDATLVSKVFHIDLSD